MEKEFVGSGGIRTHASEETGALDRSATLPWVKGSLILTSKCTLTASTSKFGP